jgi:hypothetical protein
MLLSVVVDIIPVETVIVDEASQIEIGDYLPMISRFNSKLKKMVITSNVSYQDKYNKYVIFLIRSPLVAPYGQEDIDNLESVFDKDYLIQRAHFLDTQCKYHISIEAYLDRLCLIAKMIDRMPYVIGGFYF